jgi:hypothetical protein
LARKPQKKRQWTEPVILVPIIVAIITAIVSPIIVPMIQDQMKQRSSEENEKPIIDSPTPPDKGSTPSPAVDNSLSAGTDKKSYGFGDYVGISGSVGKPAQWKTVRLDVYNSERNIFQPFNDTKIAYVPQSDI